MLVTMDRGCDLCDKGMNLNVECWLQWRHEMVFSNVRVTRQDGRVFRAQMEQYMLSRWGGRGPWICMDCVNIKDAENRNYIWNILDKEGRWKRAPVQYCFPLVNVVEQNKF